MRFDDMLATVLESPADRPDRRAARWCQLVDLLAQRKAGAAEADSVRAYRVLRETRGEVPPQVRRRAARALAGRATDPDLLAFFAEDSPAIAAPLIAEARLDPETWMALLPRLGPAARALLRHRRDLDPEVARALAAFGPSDFVIAAAEGQASEAEAPGPPAPSDAEGDSQIRELVERIEAFRRQRDDAAREEAAEGGGLALAFRWETGTDGIILWVDGAPRGPLVGQSVAATAGEGLEGVDGQAAGAFAKRAPFRDARLGIAGSGPASGDWRISGVPCFDPASGAFLGYRGAARRPRPDEVAATARATGVFGTEFPADSLRQLIHELRTPLNAIIGFAEMIEGQYLGPAAEGYRANASEIMGQARGLLGAVDDLDTAARLESRRLDLGEGRTDLMGMLTDLYRSYAALADERGVKIQFALTRNLPPAALDPATAERMVARLLAGTIGLARAGETIRVAMTMAPPGEMAMLQIAIDRPAAIEGLAESALLDPGYSPEGDWPAAPALGLGFALRLVRNLAEAVGGGLTVDESRFTLRLPPAASQEPMPGRNETGA